MAKFIFNVHLFLLAGIAVAYSQAPDTSVIIQQYRSFYPKISDRDAKAFMISQSSNEPYVLGEDSKQKKGVPEGTVTKYHWVNKKIYPGTERDYWVYVPKQY